MRRGYRGSQPSKTIPMRNRTTYAPVNEDQMATPSGGKVDVDAVMKAHTKPESGLTKISNGIDPFAGDVTALRTKVVFRPNKHQLDAIKNRRKQQSVNMSSGKNGQGPVKHEKVFLAKNADYISISSRPEITVPVEHEVPILEKRGSEMPLTSGNDYDYIEEPDMQDIKIQGHQRTTQKVVDYENPYQFTVEPVFNHADPTLEQHRRVSSIQEEAIARIQFQQSFQERQKAEGFQRRKVQANPEYESHQVFDSTHSAGADRNLQQNRRHQSNPDEESSNFDAQSGLAYSEKGEIYYDKQGRAYHAGNNLDQSSHFDAQSGLGYYDKGEIHYDEQGRPYHAGNNLDQSSHFDAQSGLTYSENGKSYYDEQGRPYHAGKNLDQSSHFDSQSGLGYYEKGEIHYDEQGRPYHAGKNLEQSSHFDAQSGSGYYEKGEIHYDEQGRPYHAGKNLEQSSHFDSQSGSGYYEKGEIHYDEQGRSYHAGHNLEQSSHFDAQSGSGYYEKGEIHYDEQSRPYHAGNNLDQSSHFDAQSGLTYSEKGEIHYDEQGRPYHAGNNLDQSSHFDAQSGLEYYDKGEIHYDEQGRPYHAGKNLEQSSHFDSQSGSGYYEKGEIHYDEQGRPYHAGNNLDKFSKSNPEVYEPNHGSLPNKPNKKVQKDKSRIAQSELDVEPKTNSRAKKNDRRYQAKPSISRSKVTLPDVEPEQEESQPQRRKPQAKVENQTAGDIQAPEISSSRDRLEQTQSSRKTKEVHREQALDGAIQRSRETNYDPLTAIDTRDASKIPNMRPRRHQESEEGVILPVKPIDPDVGVRINGEIRKARRSVQPTSEEAHSRLEEEANPRDHNLDKQNKPNSAQAYVQTKPNQEATEDPSNTLRHHVTKQGNQNAVDPSDYSMSAPSNSNPSENGGIDPEISKADSKRHIAREGSISTEMMVLVKEESLERTGLETNTRARQPIIIKEMTTVANKPVVFKRRTPSTKT